LLKIILFAYSKGITSSREIQWCCETNIIFKALFCDTVPHCTTLAKFDSQHADETEELSEQIRSVWHEQGRTNGMRLKPKRNWIEIFEGRKPCSLWMSR
jgi:transposase